MPKGMGSSHLKAAQPSPEGSPCGLPSPAPRGCYPAHSCHASAIAHEIRAWRHLQLQLHENGRDELKH